jgi:D-3-phosphoglycerate dehydrogenase
MLATDYFPIDKPPHVESLWPADQLPQLLAESDVVILCVPLNTQTQHLIGQPELAAMKRGSVLINVARGPVIDEAALISAIESGHLAGAGVDVTEIEPLPDNSKLWSLPNVIITPHVGAQSARRADDTTNLICENLRRYFSGQPLLNLVDKQLGFQIPLAMRK